MVRVYVVAPRNIRDTECCVITVDDSGKLITVLIAWITSTAMPVLSTLSGCCVVSGCNRRVENGVGNWHYRSNHIDEKFCGGRCRSIGSSPMRGVQGRYYKGMIDSAVPASGESCGWIKVPILKCILKIHAYFIKGYILST